MPPSADRPAGHAREGLVERVDGIAAWINDLDSRVRAAELATGDEKTARELRRAVEALSKHDPKLEKRLTNRVDVLADRLATLASTLSTTAASLARKDGELAALRKELEEGNRRVETLARESGRSARAEEVEELRATIRAVQSERPAQTSDARVNDLGGKVDYLTERVDTLAKTVATTAAGLVGREGEIATLRQRLDEGSARIEQTTSELRRLQDDGKLAQRLEALQTAVDATTTGLAARESEVAAVRTRIDEAYARVGTVVTDLQTSIATLSSQVAGLEALPATTEQALEARAVELNDRVDGLAERLASVATNVESAMGGLVQREDEISALHEHVEEASARVDTVVAELRQALEQLSRRGVDLEVEGRLDRIAASVASVTTQLTALETRSSTHAEDAAARAGAFEHLLAVIGERLDAVERDREGAASELVQAGEAWTHERNWVRAGLDGLAAQLADVTVPRGSEASERMLSELGTRLQSVERAGAAVASEIAGTAARWASELGAIETKLDQITASAADGAPGAHATSDRLLGELAERLDSMERDRQTVAAEITRASQAWQAERLSLETRLDKMASQLEAVESDSRGTSAGSPHDEVAQLRTSIEGLRIRLASNEQELATLVGARDSASRFDELTRRLDSLERAPVVIAGGADGGPLPGDGRFRLELRALELRMEHAEAAARENREAVLVQLERLAARIEWRFQRLETEHEATHPQAIGGGQVVPIRPAEA